MIPLPLWAAPVTGALIGTFIYWRWSVPILRCLGFRERWPITTHAHLAQAPVEAVEQAYVDGEFGPEELDWRILLALKPPEPHPHLRPYLLAASQQAALARAYSVAGGPIPVIGGDGTIYAEHRTD